jgi:hypothetical protein
MTTPGGDRPAASARQVTGAATAAGRPQSRCSAVAAQGLTLRLDAGCRRSLRWWLGKADTADNNVAH